MEAQHENSAADAHKQVAEKLDRVEGSVQKALDDIQDVSRGSKYPPAKPGALRM